MKGSTVQLICVVSGMAAGIVAGRLAKGGAGHSGSVTGSAAGKERAERSARSPSSNFASAHDFATLLKLQKLSRLGGSPHTRDLERLSPEKLRELLMELRDQPKPEGREERIARRTMIQSIAAELFKREGMDTLTWADGMEKGDFRTSLMEHLIAEASYMSASSAKPWIDRFLSENGEDWLDSFRWKLMSGAQSRGADDVILLENLFGDRFSTIQKPAIPYPDGFDYAHLFKGITPDRNRMHNHTMWYWTQVDKEAAWKGILETTQLHGKNGAYYYGALFSGADGREDPAGRKWAIAKLEEMPEEFRADAVKSVGGYGSLSSQETITVMKDLARESDRVALVSTMITTFSENEKILPGIRALGSPSAIKAALLTAAHDNRLGEGPLVAKHDQRVAENFTKLMDELEFSPGDRAEVDAMLRTKR